MGTPKVYDTNLVWFSISTAIAILLAVVAASMKDLRWLLVFVWPCAIVAIYQATSSFRQSQILITLFGAVAAAVLLFWLYRGLVEEHVFRIIRSGALISRDRPQNGSLFWVGHGGRIYPVSLLLHVNIVNTTSTQETITGYQVEFSKEEVGPWISFCKVPLRGATVYSVVKDTLADVHILQLDDLDDSLLKGPMGPHVPVSGWSAWICPRLAIHCDSKFLQMKIREAAGITDTLLIDYQKTDVEEDLLSFGGINAGKEHADISKYLVGVPSSCRQN